MPTKPTRPTKTKAPYPKVTPKLPVVYPPLRTPPNTPTKLVQPAKPTLTLYPALRPLMKPGASGFVSEPNRDPMKQPRFRVGQTVIYSGQGAPIGGKISGWAHDSESNNWYEFSSLIGKIWLPEAALTSKSVKALKQFKGHRTTITYKGVKVKGVITAVDQRAGRPVLRVKVGTTKAGNPTIEPYVAKLTRAGFIVQRPGDSGNFSNTYFAYRDGKDTNAREVLSAMGLSFDSAEQQGISVTNSRKMSIAGAEIGVIE